MLTGRRYLLEFTPEQEAFAERIADACRMAWNVGLEQRRIYRRKDRFIGYFEQCVQLTEARAEFEWLRDIPVDPVRQALRQLDRSCRMRGTRRVHYKSDRRWKPSFRFPDARYMAVERLNKRWGRVRLTGLGWARFRWTRAIGGQIRNATVNYDAGRWYISFLIEDGEIPRESHVLANTAVGVDRGVAKVAATSDGEFYDRKFASVREDIRIRRLQQRLSRAKRGSASRKRVVRLIGRHHGRTRRRRADFCAQAANTLAGRYAVVVLEDLKTSNMTASAKGTAEAPGRKVRQKSGLNRAILDKGWYLFETALRSAARYTGTEVKKVPAPYTSQTCHRCKHVDAKNRESQAVFRCVACGHTEHADVNAARNILTAAGHAVAACGDLGVGRSTKQEPVTGHLVTTVAA